jgi:hypothetical protein
MNKTMFSPRLLLFLPSSFLFPLFSFILEYLRATVRLDWVCFLSFHLCFPEFYPLTIFLKNPRKYSFSKNSRKIFLNFYVKNGAERHLGDPRGTHHATSPPWGAAQAWPRPPMVRGDPLAPHLSLHPHFLLSLPKYLNTPAQTRVLAALHHDFLISLLSPSLLLRFGAIVLRYVTPSIVQVEFCLVEYFLSILAL